MKIAIEHTFDMENSKIELILPYFFLSSSYFFPRLVKNVLKHWSKFLSQIFMKIVILASFDMEN